MVWPNYSKELTLTVFVSNSHKSMVKPEYWLHQADINPENQHIQTRRLELLLSVLAMLTFRLCNLDKEQLNF